VEINNAIQKKLIEEAKDLKGEYLRNLNRYIRDLEKSKTVEDIIISKQRILEDLVLYLPITCKDCYFCYLNEGNCKICEYAKYHGICESRWSDWRKLHKAFNKLLTAMVKYYKGERYD